MDKTKKIEHLLTHTPDSMEETVVTNRIVGIINSFSTIEHVFSLACEELRALFLFDRASIALCHKDGDFLHLFALSGDNPLAVGSVSPLKGSVTEAAIKERRPLLFSDIGAVAQRFNHYESLLAENFQSAISCPLFSLDGRAIGSFNLTSQQVKAYDRTHVLRIERFARPFALAMEKILLAQQYEEDSRELESKVLHDDVNKRISKLLARSANSATTLQVIVTELGQALNVDRCFISLFQDYYQQPLVNYEYRAHDDLLSIQGNHLPFRNSKYMERLLKTGAPVSLESTDEIEDHELREIYDHYDVQSALTIPLYIDNAAAGILEVQTCYAKRSWLVADHKLLQSIASQISLVLTNARLVAKLQIEAKRANIINNLLIKLQQSPGPQHALDFIVKQVGLDLGVDRCRAVLFGDEVSHEYVGEWRAEGISPVVDSEELRKRSPVLQFVKAQGRPIVVSDTENHPFSIGIEDLIKRNNLQSIIFAPIIHQGAINGMITVHQTRYQRNWTDNEVDMLSAVATHTGSTLENVRLISKLQEAHTLKDQFLSNLSHELLTPLNGIIGWASLLIEDPAFDTNQDLSEGIRTIEASGNSLCRLIKDLLDLTIIQQGTFRLEYEPLEVNQLIQDAVSSMGDSFAEKQLQLNLQLHENLPLIKVDYDRIQRVVWNLLSNAIKFTPAGGTVTVRSDFLNTPEDQHDVMIEVADTGIGIAESFLPLMWDRFRQFDATSTREQGGVGIGLAYVKEVMEAHGGQAEATRNVVQGMTFKIRFPMKPGEHLAAYPARESAQDNIDYLEVG